MCSRFARINASAVLRDSACAATVYMLLASLHVHAKPTSLVLVLIDDTTAVLCAAVCDATAIVYSVSSVTLLGCYAMQLSGLVVVITVNFNHLHLCAIVYYRALQLQF